eukprot:m.90632 g.90632  ORF g.90632 m.90632 type:complete len:316 (+) comp18175_c0_seq2:93-1040(+)
MLRLSRHARQLRHLSRRAQQAPPRSGSGGKSGAEPVPVVASQIVHITWGTYARPVAFAFAGSTAAFAYAAWYEKPPLARALEMQRRVRDAGRKMELATNPLEKLRHFWDTLPDSKRLISGVVCANVAVFALWRIRPLAAVMRRFFLHEAWTGRSLQLLGSAFSHKGALHLGVNMYAFYTFASGLYPVMGPEHLTAFYLSAGLMAAVSSHVLTLLRPAAMIGSLGASGAVYGLFGFMAAKYPDVKFSIVFAPFLEFTSQQMLYGVLAFDIAGLVLGWRSLDHAAHLGGLLFGLWHAYYGEEMYRKSRQAVVNTTRK